MHLSLVKNSSVKWNCMFSQRLKGSAPVHLHYHLPIIKIALGEFKTTNGITAEYRYVFIIWEFL